MISEEELETKRTTMIADAAQDYELGAASHGTTKFRVGRFRIIRWQFKDGRPDECPMPNILRFHIGSWQLEICTDYDKHYERHKKIRERIRERLQQLRN